MARTLRNLFVCTKQATSAKGIDKICNTPTVQPARRQLLELWAWWIKLVWVSPGHELGSHYGSTLSCRQMISVIMNEISPSILSTSKLVSLCHGFYKTRSRTDLNTWWHASPDSQKRYSALSVDNYCELGCTQRNDKPGMEELARWVV